MTTITPTNNNGNNDNATNATMISLLRESIRSLGVQKLAFENENQLIRNELLMGPNPMGIDTPLVDQEGFPRNDIDIYKTRSLRKRYNEIKTDRTILLQQIDEQLQQLALYSKQQKNNNNNNVDDNDETKIRLQPKPKPKYDPISKKWVVRNWDGTISGTGSSIDDGKRNFDEIPLLASTISPTDTTPTTVITTTSPLDNVSPSSIPSNVQEEEQQQPPPIVVIKPIVHHAAPDNCFQIFARVNTVENESPASIAGLQVNDMIVAFGPIVLVHNNNNTITDAMNDIARLVPLASSQLETIEVLVDRSQQSQQQVPQSQNTAESYISIYLQPRPWHGRGLLGCHIVPIVV